LVLFDTVDFELFWYEVTSGNFDFFLSYITAYLDNPKPVGRRFGDRVEVVGGGIERENF
jgi:hypothetical protein